MKLWIPALAGAFVLGGCASVGLDDDYRITSATPTSISLRYTGDESHAAGRAQDHCATYNRRAQLARVTPDGRWNLAVYDCVI